MIAVFHLSTIMICIFATWYAIHKNVHTLICVIRSAPRSVSMIALLGLERGHWLCGGNLAPWSFTFDECWECWEMLGMCLFLMKFSWFTTRVCRRVRWSTLVVSFRHLPFETMVYWDTLGHISYSSLGCFSFATRGVPFTDARACFPSRRLRCWR